MRVLLGYALLAAAQPAVAATTVFSDEVMLASDYQITPYAPDGWSTSFYNNVTYDELNTPVTILDFTYLRRGPNPASVRFHALNSAFTYDPQESGAIQTLDAAYLQAMILTRDFVPVTLSRTVIPVRVIAEQDDKLYIAAKASGTAPLTQQEFVQTSYEGFLASDFLLFDPANPNAVRTQTGLDYAGSAITFGLEIGLPGIVTSAGPLPANAQSRATLSVDNFTLRVHALDQVAAVPEPASWGMMIVGFGLIGGAVRRRRAQAASGRGSCSSSTAGWSAAG